MEEFPEESLTYYEFVPWDGPREYFLKTDSKASTLFIYYLLSNFGERVHLKNPLHLDKMVDEERKRRFRKLKESRAENEVVNAGNREA